MQLLGFLETCISQVQQLGVKYGRHAANGDQTEADHARALLDLVRGSQYLPEPVRVAEIAEAIDGLLRAHRSWGSSVVSVGHLPGRGGQ
jgi:hypothetical protein